MKKPREAFFAIAEPQTTGLMRLIVVKIRVYWLDAAYLALNRSSKWRCRVSYRGFSAARIVNGTNGFVKYGDNSLTREVRRVFVREGYMFAVGRSMRLASPISFEVVFCKHPCII